MTRWTEQSAIDDSYSARRDSEVEPYRYVRPVVVIPPLCRHCAVRLYPEEVASGLCTREWCVEWRKEVGP